MTNDLSKRRRRFAAHILARVGAGQLPLRATNDRGERFVVTALGEEPASSLFKRIRAAGGYANVYALVDGRVWGFGFVQEACALGDSPAEGLDMSFDAESTVSMLVEHLRLHPEGVRLSVSGPHRAPAVAEPKEQFEFNDELQLV